MVQMNRIVVKHSAFAQGALVCAVVSLVALTCIVGGTAQARSGPGDGAGAQVASSRQIVIPPVYIPPVYAAKWIVVDLSQQTLRAYEGNRLVFSTLISSGVAKHPTPVGTFYVYTKLPTQRMVGGIGTEHYDLPNVPNIMYFFGGDAIHGTYWHHNFGHPMSHGCINVSLSGAAWLYNWTPVGTKVVVQQ